MNNTFKIEVLIKKGINNSNLGSISGMNSISIQNHNVDVSVKEATRTLVFHHYTYFFNVADADKVVKIVNDMSKQVDGEVNIMIGSKLIEASNVTVNDLLG